ncbi:MAG: carbohydrate kinase [bacterium]|nr:carbohydrate kinase [bacterium]
MNKTEIFIFGEVLYDCFPDGQKVLGGAPFNVAWNLQAIGLEPVLVSRIGDDDNGHEIKENMTNWGMNSSAVQTDQIHPSGVVSVILNDGEPAYDIVSEVAYDFITWDEHLASLSRQAKESGNDTILYHGSLALRNNCSLSTFEKLREALDVKVFFDVNLRAPWWSKEQIHDLIYRANYLKLNASEWTLLSGHEGWNVDAARAFVQQYSLALLIITFGENGAIALDNEGQIFSVTPDQNSAVDTIGAGDAFASICLAGIIKGLDTESCLQAAQNFASRIVGLRGATTTDPNFYRDILS